MSTTSRNNKKAAAKAKPSVPNHKHCNTCKAYTKFPDGYGHMCKKTKKSCARKSTCDKHECNV